MNTLSRRQSEVLRYVESYIEAHGYSPTIVEIRDALKLRALSTVHEHLATLQRKGIIQRHPGSSRSIVVLVRSDDLGRKQAAVPLSPCCSFCGSKNMLVSGDAREHTAYICEGCAKIALELFAESRQEATA